MTCAGFGAVDTGVTPVAPAFAESTRPWRMSVARISGAPSPSRSASATFETAGSGVSASGKPSFRCVKRAGAAGAGHGSGAASAAGAFAS